MCKRLAKTGKGKNFMISDTFMPHNNLGMSPTLSLYTPYTLIHTWNGSGHKSRYCCHFDCVQCVLTTAGHFASSHCQWGIQVSSFASVSCRSFRPCVFWVEMQVNSCACVKGTQTVPLCLCSTENTLSCHSKMWRSIRMYISCVNYTTSA